MTTTRALLIDDDARLAALVADYLGARDVVVTVRADAATGLAALAGGAFDVVLLDVMLPDLDGFEVCRRIRAERDVPIIMLTARGDDADRIVGLELGADDYLPKPFNPRELLARLRAVLRRAGPAAAPAAPAGDVRTFGPLVIDRAARVVTKHGAPCHLTAHQFAVLDALAQHAGRPLSREQLMRVGHDAPHDAFDRSIDVHVARIRAAIEDDPAHPRHILTVRGVGYVFTLRPS